MDPTDYISMAGLALTVPSSALAITDIRARRATSTPTSAGAMQPSSLVTLAPLSIPRRILSMIVDFYLVAIVAGVIGTAMVPDGAPEDLEAAVGFVFLALVLCLVGWNAGSGRSPGKLLVGGRVVRFTDWDMPLSFTRSFMRVLCHAIPFGFWFVLSPSRRTAADRITDSCVIRTR